MTNFLRTLFDRLTEKSKSESGGITVLNIYFTLTVAIFGGIAIDVASLTASRTQLQVAADSAAHAALYKRWTNDAETSKAEALRIAQANMPTERYGEVLQLGNIHFGTYDQTSKTFTIDELSRDAVLVETNHLAENANPVSSFLLHLVGFWDWDVRTTAVFTRPDLPCARGGFRANGRVDMQSNNDFLNGFCIHSDTRVEFNQNNFFDVDDGVLVSVPSESLVVVPGGDFSNNAGLYAALRYGGPHNVDVNRLIDEIMAGLANEDSPHFRDYLVSDTVCDVTPGSSSSCTASGNSGGSNGGGGNGNGNGNGNGGGGGGGGLSMADLTPGRIHRVTCNGGTLDVAAETFEDVVVITDCTFSFSNGSALENATFITESTDTRTIKAPQGLRIGADDNCADGGGAQLISRGGMRTAAKMQLYGGQIIVVGDLNFAAQGNGFGGASVIAGGEIDGTSNATMGLCENGMEDFFEVRDRPRLRG